MLYWGRGGRHVHALQKMTHQDEICFKDKIQSNHSCVASNDGSMYPKNWVQGLEVPKPGIRISCSGETRDKPEKIGCVQQLEQLKNLTFVFIIFAIFDDFSEPKQAPHSNM